LHLAERIAQDLNPDLIKPAPVGQLPKLMHFFNTQIVLNETGRHLFFIDLPLLIVGVICYAAGFTKLDLVFMVLIAVLAIDTLVCLLQRVEIESWISVDADFVYETSLLRISHKAKRYLEVLNRDEANTVDEQETHESIDTVS
jgi:hypothetical protein